MIWVKLFTHPFRDRCENLVLLFVAAFDVATDKLTEPLRTSFVGTVDHRAEVFIPATAVFFTGFLCPFECSIATALPGKIPILEIVSLMMAYC